MECFWPTNLKDWAAVVTPLFVVIGGVGALYQYFQSTRLQAADTLLKVEEEFRTILPVYEQIEDVPSYEKLIKPVLLAEQSKQLDETSLKKLTDIDRCLRFFYLCCMLNDSLGVDRALGIKGGALCRAYYYYIGILLPGERKHRPELLAYTDKYYKVLTEWIDKNAVQLSKVRGRNGDGSP